MDDASGVRGEGGGKGDGGIVGCAKMGDVGQKKNWNGWRRRRRRRDFGWEWGRGRRGNGGGGGGGCSMEFGECHGC